MVRVHHSLMSASDAAPLPRLGEVFFDVRGSSRSMRLSWYADTGIAVFSIWQGGMCTGTFRLPIGDLPRMIEILQRGPDDQEPPQPAQGRRGTRDRHEPEPGRSAQREFRTGAVLYRERDDGYSAGPQDEADVSAYGGSPSGRSRAEYGRAELGGTRGSRHGRDDSGAGSWSAYDEDEPARSPWPDSGHGEESERSWLDPGLDEGGERSRLDARQHEAGGWSGYDQDGYSQDRGGGYDRDELPPRPRRGRQRHGQSESAGHRRGDEDDVAADGYGDERFVPPYVRGGPGEYGSDIPPQSADLLDDPRGAAYREDLRHSRSQSADYDPDPWAGEGYSDGPSYRLADRPAGSDDGSAGRHSASKDGGYQGPQSAAGSDLGYGGTAGEIDESTRDYRLRPVR